MADVLDSSALARWRANPVITVVLLYGGSHAEAICCANAFEQSIARVYHMIRCIIECSPLLRGEARSPRTRSPLPAPPSLLSPATMPALPALTTTSRFLMNCGHSVLRVCADYLMS